MTTFIKRGPHSAGPLLLSSEHFLAMMMSTQMYLLYGGICLVWKNARLAQVVRAVRQSPRLSHLIMTRTLKFVSKVRD